MTTRTDTMSIKEAAALIPVDPKLVREWVYANPPKVPVAQTSRCRRRPIRDGFLEAARRVMSPVGGFTRSGKKVVRPVS